MPAGRPPKYETAEQLQKKIDEYFEKCPDKRIIYNKDGEKIAEVPEYTITGLVIYCGFCSRNSFYDYEKKENFQYTIKRARTLIENHYERLLQRGNGAGAIFALKNFGWTDERAIARETADEVIQRFADAVNKSDTTSD